MKARVHHAPVVRAHQRQCLSEPLSEQIAHGNDVLYPLDIVAHLPSASSESQRAVDQRQHDHQQ
jgi:hypothetical protein